MRAGEMLREESTSLQEEREEEKEEGRSHPTLFLGDRGPNKRGQ